MRLATATTVLILILASAAAGAADVEDLNSARVPVADRSEAEFKRGIAKALEVVVVKLTGDSASSHSKAGRGVVGQAQRLVQQFGYEQHAAGGGTRTARLMLRVQFDARVLNKEMRSRGLVIWGKERPDTLVWLLVDDAGGRRLFGTQDDDPITDVMRRRADARGVPLVFPLVDITETGAAATAASPAQLEEALKASSDKYGVRSVLIGHLREAVPGLWETRWTLLVGSESLVWEQQGDIAELLVEEAADNMADALGRRYAASNAGTGSVALTVHGLTSADDYARTESYLRTLDSVTNLFVRRVEPEGIVFDLTVHGGLAGLAQSISFGQTLSPDPAGATVFRLLPR